MFLFSAIKLEFGGSEIVTLFVAIIVSILSPLVVGWVTNKQRSLEKQEDWKRQDEVAAKAAEAARLLLGNNELVANDSKIMNSKLDAIHALVNSSMTAAMQSEYGATVRELVLMKELGRPTAAIESAQLKINELGAALNDRLSQGG